MRPRRQTTSDAVGTLSMDPWNDDRVRDFVAINTIQRLRAYHLPTSAPIPVVDEVNTARALNLILLPRADPDYRPCLGEQPPSRTQLRARRRAKTRQERRERRERQQADAGQDEHSGSSSESPLASVSASLSSDDGDNTDGGTATANDISASMTNAPFSTDISTPTKQVWPRSPVASDAIASSTPLRQCAIDRARSLFFGALSFTSSTSPRRLVNSPHVPQTPSMASTTTIAGRSARHVPHSPTEAFLSTAASPLSSDARAAQNRGEREVAASGTEVGSVTATPPAPPAPSATRSLGMELDAHIEANSTPLRPPPPMRYVSDCSPAQISASTEANASVSDGLPNVAAVPSSDKAAKPEADVLCENTPTKMSTMATPSATEQSRASLEATPTAVRPPSPRLAGAEGGKPRTPTRNHSGSSSSFTDIVHTCDVCDAIIQYYQSMLTRGVVLDRYNHKDLAFVWWVLGQNMDVAALENRGPLRREALMITLRNFYYTLLTAEEAKAKATAAAAEAEKSHAEKRERTGIGAAVTSAAPGDQKGVTEGIEEHSRRTGGKVTGSSDHTAHALADESVLERPLRTRARDSNTTSTSAAAASSSRHKESRTTRAGGRTTALKRGRLEKPLASFAPDEAERYDQHPVEENVDAGTDEQELQSVMPSQGRTSLPPPQNKAPQKEGATLKAGRRAVARGVLSSRSAKEGGLATTLLAADEDEETATDVVEDGVGDVLDNEVDTLYSQTASSVVPCPSSVAQSNTTTICRRHRRAAERNKAIEETWISTRTGRRAAAIKAAEQLVLRGTAEPMTHRKPIEGVPSTNTSGESRTTVAKTLKQDGSAASEVKDVGTAAVSAILFAPASGSATLKMQQKKRVALKRERSPSQETVSGEGYRSCSRGSGGDSNVELPREKEKESSAEAPRAVSRTSASKSRNRSTVLTRAPAVSTEGAVPNVYPPFGKATVPSSDTPTTPTPESAVEAVTTSKKGGRGEEHRGRPRSSSKTLRIDPQATENQEKGVLASGTQRSQRRRDGGVLSSTVLAGTSSRTTAPHQRSDTPGMAVASPSSSALSRAGEDEGLPKLSVKEMPLRLTPHQRAVRSRIQQRMGVLLQEPPPRSATGTGSHDGIIDEQRVPVYSSYTFLLSSFRTPTSTRNSQSGGGNERQAITAPMLWYAKAIPPPMAGESASPSSSGADHSKHDREKPVAAVFTEDVLVKSGASPRIPTTATAVGALMRQRGRKRRIEGGVDPCLRGNLLRHDQGALERLVKERLAQMAESRQTAVPRIVGSGPATRPTSGSGTVQVKQEPHRSSEKEEKHGGDVHALRVQPSVLKPAHGLPLSPTDSSTVVADTTPFDPVGGEDDAVATADEGHALDQRRGSLGQCALSPKASAFGDLPYAQQCLLVWSAAGLLERHIQQRQMEEARRERLLARCGRMATRRMAARVAAVIQGGITDGNASGSTEDAAAQLAGELRGGDGDIDNGASGEDSDASEKDARGGTLGWTSGATRRVDVEEHVSCLELSSDQSASSRSSSAVSSSSCSEERFRKSMRPLPRRIYDYWIAFRSASDDG
ncbi:hypothetical protein, conserved [Leishmania tarentolae]|uniref:Uncharacterized protein n=1 Tax=Leishmania tarentolae TaxID=5689 RepID=A0A640KK14_LEITA|nr:hypothetical protein, conserved [Leishmania tarentolae]